MFLPIDVVEEVDGVLGKTNDMLMLDQSRPLLTFTRQSQTLQ